MKPKPKPKHRHKHEHEHEHRHRHRHTLFSWEVGGCGKLGAGVVVFEELVSHADEPHPTLDSLTLTLTLALALAPPLA